MANATGGVNPRNVVSVSLTVAITPNGQSLNLTASATYHLNGFFLTAANIPNVYRVYYIPLSLAGSEAYLRNLSLSQLIGVRQWVCDMSATNGTATTTVSLFNYAGGGFMYAIGLISKAASELTSPISSFVPVPTTTAAAVPANEVTRITVTQRAGTDQFGHRYNTLYCVCYAPIPITSFAEVQLMIFNYFNDGAYRTIGKMYYTGYPLGGDILQASFPLENDDGRGGVPNPGAHNVNILFVAASSTDTYRPDFATGSPFVTLGGGINA